MMKRTLLAATCSLALTVLAHAEGVEWPMNPVIGLLGASYVNATPPINSPLGGMAYIGGSYLDLTTALTKLPDLDQYRFLSDTQSGGFSYDVPGSGWKGYNSQFADMVARTNWFDGVNRLKAVISVVVNDCLHSKPCTTDDIYAYTDRIKGVTTRAEVMGVPVIITDFPPYERLNMELARQIFGLTYVIGPDEYQELQSIYRQELRHLPGVTFIDPWEHISTIDGLHPDAESMKKAAKEIAKTITKLEQKLH